MLLHRAISTELGAELSLPWVPHYLHNKGLRCRTKPPGWHREVRVLLALDCLFVFGFCFYLVAMQKKKKSFKMVIINSMCPVPNK